LKFPDISGCRPKYVAVVGRVGLAKNEAGLSTLERPLDLFIITIRWR